MSFGMRRYFLLVEEFVSGRPLDRKSLEETTDAVRLLAQLHENKRISWGPISEVGSSSVEEYIWTWLRPRVMYCLDRLQRQYGADWPADLTARIWSEFEVKAFRLTGPDGVPFRLIHGDVTRNNFLRSSNSTRMLDLLTLRYEWVGWEIVKACVSFTEKTHAWRKDLWTAYFREAGEARWREFLRQGGIGAAYYILREFAQGRAFNLRREKEMPDPEAFARRLRYILNEERLWGALPEDTDWPAIDDLFNRPVGTLRADHPERGARIVDATRADASRPA